TARPKQVRTSRHNTARGQECAVGQNTDLRLKTYAAARSVDHAAVLEIIGLNLTAEIGDPSGIDEGLVRIVDRGLEKWGTSLATKEHGVDRGMETVVGEVLQARSYGWPDNSPSQDVQRAIRNG